MTVYALADTKTQWFADRWSGSQLNLTPDTEVVVAHTTESPSWPDYDGGAKAPNYTADPNIARKRLDWRAHFPDEMSSRALKNLAGGVETNTLNAVQVELVGTCAPANAKSWGGQGKLLAGRDYIYWPEAPEWALQGLADFLADQHDRHGLVLRTLEFQPYPASFGARGGTNHVRMTFEQWRTFAGVCGHQHVPENDHGDPGALNMAHVLELVAPPKTPLTLLPIRHRIVSANLWEKNKAVLSGLNRIVARVKAAFKMLPDVIACQESRFALGELRKLEGYQTFVADAEGEGGRELGVLLRDGLKCLGTEYHHAADGVPELGGAFDHPRGIFIVKYVKRGRKVAVVNTHMGLIRDEEKIVAGREGPAAVQHAEHAQKVLRTVRRLERNGYLVFVTADANSKGKWSKSLPAVLAAAGMRVTLNRVDLVACNPKKVRSPKVAIVDRTEVGSDTHDAVAISATEKRSKS